MGRWQCRSGKRRWVPAFARTTETGEVSPETWTGVDGRGMGPRIREDNGDGGGLVVGDDRFFTPLRYVQNDMGGVLRSE